MRWLTVSLSISRNSTRNKLNHTRLGGCSHHSRMGVSSSPTQLAHVLLLLNLFLSALLARMWAKTAHKSVQIVSFSA